MASLTQWKWVWMDSGSWWWTGRPGMLRFTGSQRVGHDWATELNWTDGGSGTNPLWMTALLGFLCFLGIDCQYTESHQIILVGVYCQQMLTMVESDLSPANLKIKWLSSSCKGFLLTLSYFQHSKDMRKRIIAIFPNKKATTFSIYGYNSIQLLTIVKFYHIL